MISINIHISKLQPLNRNSDKKKKVKKMSPPSINESPEEVNTNYLSRALGIAIKNIELFFFLKTKTPC